MAVFPYYFIRFSTVFASFASHGIMCDLPREQYLPTQHFVALYPEPCSKYLPTDFPLEDIARELQEKNNKLDYCTCRMIVMSNKTSQLDEFRGFWFNPSDTKQPWFFAKYQSNNDLIVVSSINYLLSLNLNPHKRKNVDLLLLPYDWFECLLLYFSKWLAKTLVFAYVFFFLCMIFFFVFDLLMVLTLFAKLVVQYILITPYTVPYLFCVMLEPYFLFFTQIIECQNADANRRECFRIVASNYEYCNK